MDKHETLSELENAAKLVERDPFNLAAWRILQGAVESSDLLGGKSVGYIIYAIKAFEKSNIILPFKLRQLLYRSGRSYNNPLLIHQLGVLLLQECGLAVEGQELIDHASLLSGKSTAVSSKEDSSKDRSTKSEFGINQNPPARIAKITFRKTGRCQFLRLNEGQHLQQQEAEAIDKEFTIPEDTDACLRAVQSAIKNKKTGMAYRWLSTIDGTHVSTDILWDMWTDLGELYFSLALYPNASECYEKASTLIPDLLISQFNRGAALQMIGREDQALEAYFRADGITPNHPKVWCNIGTVYFLKNQFIECESALRRCLTIQPNYARAWDNLACVLGAQGKMEESYWACSRALLENPNYLEARFKMGIMLFLQERFVEALPLLLDTVSHPSLSAFAHAYLSMTFSMMGNVLAARQALSGASGIDNEVLAAAWSRLGHAYRDSQLIQSREAYYEAVRLHPESAEYWTELALINQRFGDKLKAAKCFQKAREVGSLWAKVA